MVIINGTEFPIYNLDTENTVVNRIAANLNTIPKFLYFQSGKPNIAEFHSFVASIVVEDIFSIIKNNSNSDDFIGLYEKIKDKIKPEYVDDVVKIFISYNTILNENDKTYDDDLINSFLFHFVEKLKYDVNIIFSRKLDINDFIANRKANLKYYEEIIKNNRENSLSKEKEFMIFNKIKGIPFEEFELEKINFEMDLKTDSMSLMEIFNNIELTDFTPFVSCSNFFKIRKDFIPPLSWEFSNENIILKILQKTDMAYVISDYTDVILSADVSSGKIKATLKYNITKNVSRDEIIKRFVDVLHEKEESFIENIIEKEINGVFYFQNQRLNRYVFSDLILNNKEFSDYLIVDETIISQKSTIFVYFNSPETGEITAYLTEKIVNNKDPIFKNKPQFFENSYCVRVKISTATNIKSVTKFQEILSILFVKYNEEYPKIISFYNEFIPLKDLEKTLVITPKPSQNKTKDMLDPELFVSNYSRFCGESPTLINDEEEEDYLENGKQVLTFPKEITNNILPKKYICDYKKYKYPGLRPNTLNNSDKFNYLPCCFEADQQNKPEYRNYYYGEEIIEKNVDQYIIKTNKILANTQVGLLPQNITDFFHTIEMDRNYEFYRLGVLKTKSSFLNCVLYALGKLKDVDDVEKFVSNERLELANINYVPACKQEMYGYSSKSIMNKINDLEDYFNPNLFIHLLEEKYNCNIFLFKRDTENLDGTLSIPSHIKGYYKMKKVFEKSIFIYEHNGIDSDNSKYPKCELIFRWNKKGKKDDLQYSFDYGNYITQKSLEIFADFNEFYVKKEKVYYTYFNIPEDIKIVSQSIDFYGKTRRVNVSYKDNIISIYTSPMQPMLLPEDLNVYKPDIRLATEFADVINLNNKNISKENIKGRLGNVEISIPLNSILEKDRVSEVNTYNKYKKLSRYIKQYFYWFYSKFLNETEKEPGSDNFEEFKNIYITIKKDFDYGNVVKTFSVKNELMLGGKLVIKTEETLRRLFYCLSNEIMHNPQKIKTYHARISIENFYLEISDFDNYPSQIILSGVESVSKFIKSNSQDDIQYKIQNSIIKETLEPYFFKNNLVGDKIYLAQNTISIQKALDIYTIWKTKKYNILYDPYPSNINHGFVFYAYKNNKLIKPYYIVGEDTSNSIKIIGYKIRREDNPEYAENEYFEEKSFFTILLPL